VLSIACVLLVAAQAVDGQRLLERVKGSVVTVEVHSGSSDARDVLGSGYFISADGHVLTNYHVVATYIDEPDRYQIRVKNGNDAHAARLLSFDLINDLALLEVAADPRRPSGLDRRAAPLTLAAADPPRGEPVYSLGNPSGFGLSLIEGVFNGYVEKGFVDRQLLSMPLNSGMSGGPILNRTGQVIGTNVSVIWGANSLSFGVPSAKARALLAAPRLTLDAKGLRAEVTRQLLLLEHETATRVVEAFEREETLVAVGALSLRQPPALFDCWNASQVFKDEGVTKVHYGCNLQFTPTVVRLGAVGSVELEVEHFASHGNRYGFYGALGQNAARNSDFDARDPTNGYLSAPSCTAERVRTAGVDWQVNTCATALVKHPGLFHFEVAATTLSAPFHGANLRLNARGMRVETFLALARAILGGARLGAQP
jgi:serine protease Do